jgi:hypothetical protein
MCIHVYTVYMNVGCSAECVLLPASYFLLPASYFLLPTLCYAMLCYHMCACMYVFMHVYVYDVAVYRAARRPEDQKGARPSHTKAHT